MNYEKIGTLIRKLRIEKGLTQNEIAEKLHISNKTVSKWECGAGCPDISLFPALSELSGNLDEKPADTGNLRNLSFYICSDCGNLITSTSRASISCCGKTLAPQKLQRAGEEICVSLLGSEYYISSGHEMSRDHYITFVALRSSDQVLLRKLYPEWNVELQMPYIPGAMMIWHCKKHGLFYQPLPRYQRPPRNRNS